MVIATAYYSGGCQFNTREKPNSHIMKFVFRTSGDLNFVILVENSSTGGPNSISVRMEYLFIFQFSYCGLCVGNR